MTTTSPQEDAYAELSSLIERGCSKLDPRLLLSFNLAASFGKDVNQVVVPFILTYRDGDREEIAKIAPEADFFAGNQAGVQATAASVLRLLAHDSVIALSNS